MSRQERGQFSQEAWVIVGNPLPENLINAYMRYYEALEPHERKIIIQVPNPNDGYIKIKNPRAALEARDSVGISLILKVLEETLAQLTPEERKDVIENGTLIDVAIQELEKSTEEKLRFKTLDPSASHYF